MPKDTARDKSLHQSTIMKVNRRIRRLGNDKNEQEAHITQLTAELRQLEAQIEQETSAVLCARDDENELVLRFVEAKLLHELLSDERSALDDELVQSRRDITSLGGDLQVKERTRSRLLCVEDQRRNELVASERGVQECRRQSDDVYSSLRSIVRQSNAVKGYAREEGAHLGEMKERLHGIREAVADALQSCE